MWSSQSWLQAAFPGGPAPKRIRGQICPPHSLRTECTFFCTYSDRSAVRVVSFVICAILAAAHAPHPRRVGPIPFNRLRQAAREIRLRAPSRLAHEFLARERIPPVVTRTIRHISDERLGLARERKQLADDLQIRQRPVASDVVD